MAISLALALTEAELARALSPAVALLVATAGYLVSRSKDRKQERRQGRGSARLIEDELRSYQTELGRAIHELRWPAFERSPMPADDMRVVATLIEAAHEWSWVASARNSMDWLRRHADPQYVQAGTLQHAPGVLARMTRTYWRAEVARLILHEATSALGTHATREQFRLHGRGDAHDQSLWMDSAVGDPLLRSRLWPKGEDPNPNEVDEWSSNGGAARVLSEILADLHQLRQGDPIDVGYLSQAQLERLIHQASSPTDR